MITSCEVDCSIVLSKIDMKCPFDKMMTQENIVKDNYIKSMLEGDEPAYQEGWEERRRQALLRYKETPIEEDPSLFWDSYEYSKYMANHRLIQNHIVELLKDPPAWVGCSDGKIVTGESKLDVFHELKACSYPRLFLNLVD